MNMSSYGSFVRQTRRNIWKWKQLILFGFLVYCFWMLRVSYSPRFPRNITYSQNGLDLETFAAPFTCDPRTLPSRSRIIRRAHENYVLLGHGFDDVVSNYNWDAEGDDGWENELTQQMEKFMEAIQDMEPSRTVFMDLGANIGTHMLHIASRGYETHGFEPTYANYVLAHCSLAMSGLTGPIRFNQFGLGDKVERVCMDSIGWNMGDTRVNTAEHCDVTKQATLDTLDNYYKEFLGERKVALLKIDVQGYEVNALVHGTSLFDSNNAPEVVMFEYEPARLIAETSDPRDLINYFESRDYSIWHFGTKPFGTWTPGYINGTSIAWRESDHFAFEHIPGGVGYFDLVAIKKSWKSRAEDAGYHFIGGTIEKK